MDAQEIFDVVAKHLGAQGRKSVQEGTTNCKYRGAGGCKCAVGILLTDEEYRPEFDARSMRVQTIALEGYLPKRLRRHESFLADMQAAHDRPETGERVVEHLRNAAVKHRLSPAILDVLTFPEVWK